MRIDTNLSFLVPAIFLCACLLPFSVLAQEQNTGGAGESPVSPVSASALGLEPESSVQPAPESDPRTDRGDLEFFSRDIPDPRTIPSLFFFPWTQSLVKDYRERAGTEDVRGLSGDPGAAASEKDRGLRELSLGGIVYQGADDWTIWFNGQRVTPRAWPEQVQGLTVRKNYIDVQWYDPYTNVVFPVRLRPHQRFNLDSRIFLPG